MAYIGKVDHPLSAVPWVSLGGVSSLVATSTAFVWQKTYQTVTLFERMARNATYPTVHPSTGPEGTCRGKPNCRISIRTPRVNPEPSRSPSRRRSSFCCGPRRTERRTCSNLWFEAGGGVELSLGLGIESGITASSGTIPRFGIKLIIKQQNGKVKNDGLLEACERLWNIEAPLPEEWNVGTAIVSLFA